MFGFDWFDLLKGLGAAVNDEPRPDGESLWDDPNLTTEGHYRAQQARLDREHQPPRPSVPYLRQLPSGDDFGSF